jgi:GAF domain-containing protein
LACWGVANREGGYSSEQQEDLEAIVPAIVQALQRKRAEKEIGLSINQLDLALDAANAGILEWDIRIMTKELDFFWDNA